MLKPKTIYIAIFYKFIYCPNCIFVTYDISRYIGNWVQSMHFSPVWNKNLKQFGIQKHILQTSIVYTPSYMFSQWVMAKIPLLIHYKAQCDCYAITLNIWQSNWLKLFMIWWQFMEPTPNWKNANVTNMHHTLKCKK